MEQYKYVNFARSITKYNSDFPYTKTDLLMKMRQTGLIQSSFLGDVKGHYLLYIKREIKFNIPGKGLVRIVFEKKKGEFFPKLKHK